MKNAILGAIALFVVFPLVLLGIALGLIWESVSCGFGYGTKQVKRCSDALNQSTARITAEP